MRRILSSLAIVMIVCTSTSVSPAYANGTPSQTAPSSNPAMRLVNTALAAVQRIDGSALARLYSDDAVFVDEGPPYVWRGANAGSSWASHIHQGLAKMKMRNFVTTVQKPTTTHISATGAYIVVPMVLNGTTSRGPFHEDGAFTFTLRNRNGTWKITSQTWTVR